MLLFPKDNLSGSLHVTSSRPAPNTATTTAVRPRPSWLKIRTKEEYRNARMLKRNFNETWESFKSRFYQEIKVIKSMMTINEGSLQSKKVMGASNLVGE